jgi:hypothetical protein
VLLVHTEWLHLILSGSKSWELRGSRTNIRERIGLAASGSGLVFGTVELSDCIGPLPRQELSNTFDKHRVNELRLLQVRYRSVFAWVMKDPDPFGKPIPFDHPTGAVIWVRV